MEFIKKLLGRGEAPEPQPETVTLAYHNATIDGLKERLRHTQSSVGTFLKQRDLAWDDLATARAEADANAVELAQWRQYGQMRDPKTGRLVPRVKAEVAANV